MPGICKVQDKQLYICLKPCFGDFSLEQLIHEKVENVIKMVNQIYNNQEYCNTMCDPCEVK